MAASPLKCFGYRPQASTVTFASAERKTPQNHELSEKKDAVRGPRSDGPSKDLTSSPGAKVSVSARMVSYVILPLSLRDPSNRRSEGGSARPSVEKFRGARAILYWTRR